MFRGIVLAGVLAVVPTLASAQQCTTDARHVVDELYRHILERSADAASNGWVEKLNSGTTVREIVRQLASSPEHQQRFYNPGEGAAANERAVGTLYRHILGRQPDAAGMRAFANAAASNGFGAVIDAIVSSPEYTQTFGDWGVPGAGGMRFCGTSSPAAAVGTSGVAPEMRWANLDLNHDSIIQRSEWRGNARAFMNRDWNGDGVLSGDEVRVGAVAPATTAVARDYGMPNDDRFYYLDVNNNGAVESNEWDGSLDTFYRLDRNNDNKLSRAEIGTVSGTPFNNVDTNRDGRIALSEWPYSHRSFDDQDTNGDGVITPAEFRPAAVGAR